jgi:hypothetical protein
MAARASPCWGWTAAVDLDDGGVDHGVFHIGTASNSRFQTSAFTQSRKRVYTLLQFPKAGGRSR